MNKNKLFTIQTCMTKEDYNKFIYIATFLRSKIILAFIIIMSALVSGILSYNTNQFSIIQFIIYWIALIIAAVLGVISNVKIKNKKIIKVNKTVRFNSQETFDFYEEFFIITSTAFQGEAKINYIQLSQILETKDYFIIYIDANQAYLIRKKDMDESTIEKLKSLLKNNIINIKYKEI